MLAAEQRRSVPGWNRLRRWNRWAVFRGNFDLNPRTRQRFDALLDEVLAELPDWVLELFEQVPLHVEDYPSDEVMAELGVRYPDQLCGLYTGVPLTDKSVNHGPSMPDVVTIYRRGILAAARGHDGRVRTERLRREIRITVLHELAHHHGIDEDELGSLGYG